MAIYNKLYITITVPTSMFVGEYIEVNNESQDKPCRFILEISLKAFCGVILSLYP